MVKDEAWILDATAGNRTIWRDNKYPEGVVFMDKEPNLHIPPDVIATWDKVPFPDNYFNCVIFDPPHFLQVPPPWYRHPNKIRKGRKNSYEYYYGWFNSKEDCISQITKAQKEFARVSSRLCFKWYDEFIPINNMLSLFDCWDVQFKQEYLAHDGRTSNNENRRRGHIYWVKMVKKLGKSD